MEACDMEKVGTLQEKERKSLHQIFELPQNFGWNAVRSVAASS
jgi:hypothetical protein